MLLARCHEVRVVGVVLHQRLGDVGVLPGVALRGDVALHKLVELLAKPLHATQPLQRALPLVHRDGCGGHGRLHLVLGMPLLRGGVAAAVL